MKWNFGKTCTQSYQLNYTPGTEDEATQRQFWTTNCHFGEEIAEISELNSMQNYLLFNFL